MYLQFDFFLFLAGFQRPYHTLPSLGACSLQDRLGCGSSLLTVFLFFWCLIHGCGQLLPLLDSKGLANGTVFFHNTQIFTNTLIMATSTFKMAIKTGHNMTASASFLSRRGHDLLGTQYITFKIKFKINVYLED